MLVDREAHACTKLRPETTTHRRTMQAKLRRGFVLAVLGAGLRLAVLTLVHIASLGRGMAAAGVIGAVFMAYEVYAP